MKIYLQMYDKILDKVLKQHHADNETVALAVIVRRDAPTSGKPGDKALITSDGTVHGWIGGGCTKGIVIKEAREAIKQGTPRLVKIQPGLDAPELAGVKNYKMTCMSGGTVEVYVEPIMPKAKLKIFGRSHIARALSKIGNAAGFSITVVSDLADAEMFEDAEEIINLKNYEPNKTALEFCVVCTQGEDDEKSLLQAIKTGTDYISFVSSHKKANSVLMALKREGISHDQLVRIKTPAGLDINAKTPEEVAISILAQIIEHRRNYEKVNEDQSVDQDGISSDLYVNPVCNIPVQKSTAKHVLEYNDEKVYFCCDGCKESFEKEPEAYMK